MVRLKTDRWYSSRGQEKSRRVAKVQSLGMRRVVSLCLLLALVVILMKKAADPRYISSAFRQLGVPLEGELNEESLKPPVLGGAQRDEADTSRAELATSQLVVGHSGASVGDDEKPGTAAQRGDSAATADPGPAVGQVWSTTRKDLTRRLFKLATEQERDRLSQLLFPQDAELQGNQAKATPGDFSRLLLQSEKQLDDLRKQLEAQDETQGWVQSIDRFSSQWLDLLETGSTGELEFSMWRDLRAAAYDHLVSQFVDSTIWKESEKFAFDTLLSELPNIVQSGDESSPEVVTRQLLAEPDLLRGNVVRFSGELRRYDQHEFGGPEATIEPEPTVSQYVLLWMRGADDANQPVAVYASRQALNGSVAASLEGLPQSKAVSAESSFSIEVTGVFVKQLAYAGNDGMQVAPVLFAGEVEKGTADSAAVAAITETPRNLWRDVAYAFAIALAFGGAFIVAVLPGFRKSRRVRSLMRPAEAAKSKSSDTAGQISRVILPLMIGIPGLGQLSDQKAFAQDTTPPWADASAVSDARNSAAIEYLESKLSVFWSQNAAERIDERYGGPEVEQFVVPDEVLKVQQAIQKAGLERVAAGLKSAGQGEAEGQDELPFTVERLEGMLVDVQVALISREQRNWFGTTRDDTVYRLLVNAATANSPQPTMGPSQTGHTATESHVVYVNHMPELIVAAEEVYQPVVVEALRIDGCSAAFSDRISWVLGEGKPSSSAEEIDMRLLPELAAHQLAVSRAGWDLAYLDLVEANQQKSLLSNEAESFFGFLAASRKYGQRHYERHAVHEPLAVMREAKQNCGREVQWVVRAVRGSSIAVPQEILDASPGMPTKYYQIDGFVHLGNKRISFTVPTETGDDELLFDREFPITVVTFDDSSVPADVLSGRVSVWDVDRYLQVDGLFYRMWEYQSDLVASKNAKARQAAPLVAATLLTPTQLPVGPTQANPIAWFGVAMCVAVLVILAGILYLALRRDVRLRRRNANLR